MSFQPTSVFSSASSDQLMNNFMNALTGNNPERRALAPVYNWSSPDSRPSVAFDGDILLGEEDLMLPDAAFSGEASGSSTPKFADATVVTNASLDIGSDVNPPTIITTSKSNRKSSAAAERRHSLPTSVMLSDSKLGNTLTQPVPEFLCHLFTMLRDENLHGIISWCVPTQDESDCMGGGIRGIGKIVCHKPDTLQDFVLGKYYRHSKYASFQRQLNYFGFKKRLHGGKKGKLSPCSYVHEGLDANVESLLVLKRRPPVKKRAPVDGEDVTSVSSVDDEAEKVMERPKKRRTPVKDKAKKIAMTTEDGDKKPHAKQVAYPSMPIPVEAEEYAAPSATLLAASNNALFVASTLVASRPIQVPTVSHCNLSVMTNAAPASATLAQLLSTALPPTDVLFDDDFSVDLNTGIAMESSGSDGFYVNDQGRCFSHNSLVNLAMFY